MSENSRKPAVRKKTEHLKLEKDKRLGEAEAATHLPFSTEFMVVVLCSSKNLSNMSVEPSNL